MKQLLLIIDYQVDFVAASGQLTAGEPAQAIEKNLVAAALRYRSAGNTVICTLDTHHPDHWSAYPESTLFPLHCAEDTPGWQLYGHLADLHLPVLKKHAYMLEQTDIDQLVRLYDQIELAGVTTDICVLQNAIGLYNHAANIGKPVKFICSRACVASFDPDGHEYALNYMAQKLGFDIR